MKKRQFHAKDVPNNCKGKMSNRAAGVNINSPYMRKKIITSYPRYAPEGLFRFTIYVSSGAIWQDNDTAKDLTSCPISRTLHPYCAHTRSVDYEMRFLIKSDSEPTSSPFFKRICLHICVILDATSPRATPWDNSSSEAADVFFVRP